MILSKVLNFSVINLPCYHRMGQLVLHFQVGNNNYKQPKINIVFTLSIKRIFCNLRSITRKSLT